jgi:hypothetical protein
MRNRKESAIQIVKDAKAMVAKLKRRGWKRADFAKALGKMLDSKDGK